MVCRSARAGRAGLVRFPFCRRIKPVDASKPDTSLMVAWDGVRIKAGVDCRLHDLRHSFCTKLAEAGARVHDA
jgi:integrase